MTQERPLREIIKALPEGSVIFRTDYPQYHAEFVGKVLSQLVEDNKIIKIAQGIYIKPYISRFGPVKPSISKIAESIAKRDDVQILPVGETALNELGLSTQVPVNYTFLTSGSARKINIGNQCIIFKRGVPRNFMYKTKLAAYLVQALRALGEENITETDLSQIGNLMSKEKDINSLTEDLMCCPAWMRRILKPMLDSKKDDNKTLD